MLLLITSAGDGTSDRIVSRLGDFVFRYNFDQANQYVGHFSPDRWALESPVGRRISSETATAVIWWKAFAAPAPFEDKYLREEAKYFFREIYNWFRLNSKVKGNDPEFHNQLGKINILRLASKYFKTPVSLFTWGLRGQDMVPTERRIIKSVSSSQMNDGKSLFTTDVSNRQLDGQFPWFLQEKIIASEDITVFQVGARFFAFSRSRESLKGVDWRAEQSFDADIEEWIRIELDDHTVEAFERLSRDLSVNWGRYDLMRCNDGGIYFLEFNANGQWVFLDYKDRHGVLDAVIDYLKA